MTTNKKQTEQKAVVDKPSTAPEKALSKHDQTAVDAAKTNTKNDGSHIVKQRQALIDNAKTAQVNQETK